MRLASCQDMRVARSCGGGLRDDLLRAAVGLKREAEGLRSMRVRGAAAVDCAACGLRAEANEEHDGKVGPRSYS